ncbi:MAG: hypothetical protein AABW80_04920 [Nanoarchaeota archaeon]
MKQTQEEVYNIAVRTHVVPFLVRMSYDASFWARTDAGTFETSFDGQYGLLPREVYTATIGERGMLKVAPARGERRHIAFIEDSGIIEAFNRLKGLEARGAKFA